MRVCVYVRQMCTYSRVCARVIERVCVRAHTSETKTRVVFLFGARTLSRVLICFFALVYVCVCVCACVCMCVSVCTNKRVRDRLRFTRPDPGRPFRFKPFHFFPLQQFSFRFPRSFVFVSNLCAQHAFYCIYTIHIYIYIYTHNITTIFTCINYVSFVLIRAHDKHRNEVR